MSKITTKPSMSKKKQITEPQQSNPKRVQSDGSKAFNVAATCSAIRSFKKVGILFKKLN